MRVTNKNDQHTDLLCLKMFKYSILTEKTIKNEMKYNCMTFVVNNNITKEHIKIAFKSFFDIIIKNVRVINTKGKQKRFQGRKFQTNGVKKVMVRVPDLNRIKEVLNV